jgi:hypothetical protein
MVAPWLAFPTYLLFCSSFLTSSDYSLYLYLHHKILQVFTQH